MRLILPSTVVLGLSVLSATAQQPPPAPAVPPRDLAFPAQQRPLADPAVIEHGKTLYGIHCRLCHGPDLRGGDMGGVNLLRSAAGVERPGRRADPPRGDPRAIPAGIGRRCRRWPLAAADVKAVAAYIHSVAARGARQGGPPPGPPVELNIVVGDAARGQKYFGANCASCHSATGDLAGVATRYPEPMQLQNAWVGGPAAGFAAASGPALPQPPRPRRGPPSRSR